MPPSQQRLIQTIDANTEMEAAALCDEVLAYVKAYGHKSCVSVDLNRWILLLADRPGGQKRRCARAEYSR